MSSIAAIDRRCFVSPPATPARPALHAPQEALAPRANPSFLLTWRPPLERAGTRRQV